MHYTGIGSRLTPAHVRTFMGEYAWFMASNGYTLRSGYAAGADQAFYTGYRAFLKDSKEEIHQAKCENYLPFENFNGCRSDNSDEFIVLSDIDEYIQERAYGIAQSVHPAWENCDHIAQSLHARNVFQILGRDLSTPSQIVVCWTKAGAVKGGTATAIRVAKLYNIPVWNLGDN